MQFDFLGSTAPRSLSQAMLFDDNFKPIKHRAAVDYSKADAFFQSLDKETIDRYKNYWAGLAPCNDSERFQRFLFALMSVRTSWQNNIAGYLAIKNWPTWFNRKEALETLLKQSGVGLHNQRLAFVEAFAQHFWGDIKKFNKLSTESWRDYRNRLEKDIAGLGLAKTSFALELLAPMECEVFCADTHLFQLYGLHQKRDIQHYETIEAHWVSMSKLYNVPSYIARCIWWDRNQNKTDSRYWSYVLEI